MLIILQIPLLDLRGFERDTGRLRKPTWPIPSLGKDFVRNFGAIVQRPRRGLDGWLGEDNICNAKNAVKCDREIQLQYNIQECLRVLFRRFYFDGLAVGKFEIGFSTKNFEATPFSDEEIAKALSDVLALPVRVRFPENKQFCGELISIGDQLAKMYLYATTSVRYEGKIRPSLVRSGTPMLLLDHVENYNDVFLGKPLKSQFLCTSDGVDLFHNFITHRNHKIHNWCIQLSEKQSNRLSKEKARILRIYLERLHAEHECLRLALRSIQTKSIEVSEYSVHSDTFQQYLNEATRRIGILRNKTVNQFDDSIYEVAKTATSTIRPGELNAINQVLDSLNLRRNVRRKVDQYTEEWNNELRMSNNITFVEHLGDKYVGDVYKDIHNSMLTTRGSIAEGIVLVRQQHEESIANSLITLDDLIASATETDLSPEKKKECLEMLNALTGEAKKTSPSKPVLKILGESLLGSLSNVASISKAVSECFGVLKSLWS